jgi:hypothetical protein
MYPLACSGPGAANEIALNIAIAFMNAAIAVGLLVISLVFFFIGPRNWIVPPILVGLIALHPAWTISAISGDCGEMKFYASLLFTGIGVLAFGFQGFFWFRYRFSRRPRFDI